MADDENIVKGMRRLFERLERSQLTPIEREFVARAKRNWEVNRRFEFHEAAELESLLSRFGLSLAQ
jgi:hypothetical protein